jgi:hypothetical protein
MKRSIVGLIISKGYRPFNGEWMQANKGYYRELDYYPTATVLVHGVRWALCLNPDTAKYYGAYIGGDVYITSPKLRAPGPQIINLVLGDNTKITMEFDTLEQAITCCDLTD